MVSNYIIGYSKYLYSLMVGIFVILYGFVGV